MMNDVLQLTGTRGVIVEVLDTNQTVFDFTGTGAGGVHGGTGRELGIVAVSSASCAEGTVSATGSSSSRK
jgi:hypothetical protein